MKNEKFRYLSPAVCLAEGEDKNVVLSHPLLRTGVWHDERYGGEFRITPAMMEAMVANFAANVTGIKLQIDVAHEITDGAGAEVVDMWIEPFVPPSIELMQHYTRHGIPPMVLMGRMSLNEYGIDAVKKRGMCYISGEYHDDYTDKETSRSHGPTLVGGAFTARPVQRHQPSISLSEPTLKYCAGAMCSVALDYSLTTTEDKAVNKEKMKLRADLAAMPGMSDLVQLSDMLVDEFDRRAALLSADQVADGHSLQAIADAVFDKGRKALHEIQDGKKHVTITLAEAQPTQKPITGEDVSVLVAKALAEQKADELAKQEQHAVALAEKQKLFGDIVAEAKISDAAKKLAVDSARITHDMPSSVVKILAESAVKLAMAEEASGAAQFLSEKGGVNMGGYGRVSVSHENEIKELAEHVQRVTGFTNTSPASEKAKVLADEIIREFDAKHGHRLVQEHTLMKRLAGHHVTSREDIKRLSGGDISISDASVPTVYEREVIRQALYTMRGLELCNVGTSPFAPTVDIPYSYRDTSSAGGQTTGALSPKLSTRVYEGQAIQNSQEIMTSELAYPIPIKIAVSMSDEYRLLASTATRDWDAIADNMRNLVRVVGEAKDAGIFDEILASADEYSTVAVTTENLELQANGSKNIFVTAGFPIVRPRKYFNTKGVQQGSTLFPIVVSYNSVALSEYDGTGTQASGTYYSLNYNLGEISLVNQAGVLQAPADNVAYTISYSYSTNSDKFDIDLGALSTADKWDTFLYAYGQRQAVITDSRQYRADMGIMSRSVMNRIRQAGAFKNCYRDGANTTLRADGALGYIWDTENFNSNAPGLWLADNRLVIGEKGSTRFRMLKPWAMEEMENMRDSNGKFVGKKSAYGSEWVIIHTPTQLKKAYTSMVLYSGAGRVARVA